MQDDAKSSWLQQHKKTARTVVILLCICCLVFIICTYIFRLDWTGFNASQGPNVLQYQPTKRLWDWLQLLIVPAALSIVAIWFNRTNGQIERRMTAQRDKTERAIALDNQRAKLLHDYLDRMSDLLLERKLQNPQTRLEAQNIARARTLIVLPCLDDDRKGKVVQFLYESGLITSGAKDCISLHKADLKGADLRDFELSGADLRGVDLSEAKLSKAHLSEAQLQETCLHKADLSEAILREANLYRANLSEATLNGAVLQEVNLIKANLSDAWLAQVDATRANFSDAIVNGARYEHLILDGATISQAQLNKM